MRIGRIVLLACLMASFTHRAMAMPIAFDFSFLDFNTGNTVSGVVSGLQDNATTCASSVLVSSNSGGYGIGEYVGNPLSNSWTVSGGVITTAAFESSGYLNVAPAITCCSMGFITIAGISAGLHDTPISKPINIRTKVTFQLRQGDVPIPSALALLGVGLFGLGVSRRKRKLNI